MSEQPSTVVGDSSHEYPSVEIQLLKNETLGTGSYGTVYKAKFGQLICAAKSFHEYLVQTQTPEPGKEHRQPALRFIQECQFLSRVSHPNIVQYLWTYREPGTDIPILLMELMDESLTHFLESSPKDVPFHLQVSLSYDVAQALAFLHDNGIIHRDLSSYNVLLLAGSRAKVSDFGMSKFKSTHQATMTMCPGTPVYMPPEALDDQPMYEKNLDIFSFGVLLIQILTKKFPDPDVQFEIERIPDPRNPKRTVDARIPIPEFDRRKAHISLVESTHPLLPIALECLKDEPNERPSSQDLCKSLEEVKKTARYKESLPKDLFTLVKAKDEQIQEMKRILQHKEEVIQAKIKESESLEEKVKQLEATLYLSDQKCQALRDEKQALQERINDQELQLTRARSAKDSSLSQQDLLQRSVSDTGIKPDATARRAHLRERGCSLDPRRRVNSIRQTGTIFQSPSSPGRPRSKHVSHDSSSRLTHWKLNQRLPIMWNTLSFSSDNLHSGSSAVIDGIAYFTARAQTIHKYTTSAKQWDELPQCPLTEFAIVAVDDMLTTVGGMLENWRGIPKYSNKLFCFSNNKWIESYPPMPTCRSSPGAVYTHNRLVVMGGFNLSDGTLTTVEILDIALMQWSSASPLPFKASHLSVALSKDFIYFYVHARYTPSEHEAKSVMKCSLATSNPSSVEWERIASLDVCKSSLVVFNDHLLALGGEDSDEDCVEDVHLYDPNSNSWEYASQMAKARCKCLTAVLSENELLVVGGESDQEIEMEMAHL